MSIRTIRIIKILSKLTYLNHSLLSSKRLSTSPEISKFPSTSVVIEEDTVMTSKFKNIGREMQKDDGNSVKKESTAE
jgi:hypothetical protein